MVSGSGFCVVGATQKLIYDFPCTFGNSCGGWEPEKKTSDTKNTSGTSK